MRSSAKTMLILTLLCLVLPFPASAEELSPSHAAGENMSVRQTSPPPAAGEESAPPPAAGEESAPPPAAGEGNREKAETETPAPDNGIREEIEAELKHLSEETSFSEWQRYFDELPALTGRDSEYDSIERMIESIALSGGEVKGERIAESLGKLLFPSFIRSVKRLMGVVALAMLTGFCGIAAGGDKNSVKSMLMLFFCAAAVLGLTAMFSDIAAETAETLKKTERFTAVTEPILMGLLSVLGCRTSVKLLSPALVFLSGGIIAFIKRVVMPALLAAGVLTVLDGLAGRIRLTNTVKLFRKAVKWLLGLATTVYIAVTAIGGISAGIADGISLRTAKYAIDRMIPAVGGMVTGAVDAAIGGALLLKNAAGMVSVILLAALVLKPLIGLLGSMLALRAAAAVTEPFSDERIVKMLEGMAENMSLLFASVAAAAGMFVITAVIIISAGGTLAG